MISATTVQDMEAALAVAAPVLAGHGLSEHDIKRVALYLHGAKSEKYWQDEIDDDRRTECAHRDEIIKTLERLAELYRNHEPSLINFHPATHEPLTAERITEEIEIWLASEKRLPRTSRLPKKPRNRRTSAKNAEAETILKILIQYPAMDTWKACGLIAEMFVRAGIEDKPRDKVQRALYDKLSRI